MRKYINQIVLASIAILLIIASEMPIQAQQSKNNNSKNQAKQQATLCKDTCRAKCVNSCTPPVGANCNHFIDKDGDGINDNRCSGMGIGRKRKHGEVIHPDSVNGGRGRGQGKGESAHHGRKHRNRGE